jgi:hypothetical protein
MYYLYSKSREGDEDHFIRKPKEDHLFGCRVGRIPLLLKDIMPQDVTEPYSWHLPFNQALIQKEQQGVSLVIDLRPKVKETISLYELLDVWGYSDNKWTPIMLMLRALFIEEPSQGIDTSDFSIKASANPDRIYTFLHLDGTIIHGDIVGRWLPSSPSSTNSVLLWPNAMNYFIDCVRTKH